MSSVNGDFGDKGLQGQTRKDYKADVFKSLDTLIQERGYKKPPSYKARFDRGENLPISSGGRNEKLLSNTTSGGRPSSLVSSSSSSSDFTCRRTDGTGKLDAMSNSLDAIISDRALSQDEELGEGNGERWFEKRRRTRTEFEEKVRQAEMESDSTNTNGYRPKRPRVLSKMTPYKAITYLADIFLEIEIKMGKKVKYKTEEMIPQKWRCVVKCGAIEAVADSFRRIVAREIACQEFLNKLKDIYPDGQIPEYELPKEIMLDPQVFEAIDVLGKEIGTPISFQVGNDERAIVFGDKPAEMYKCVYQVDKREFIGRSSSKEFAQLEAAGKLYETLTGTEFPLSKYSTGSDCDSFEEYDFSESKNWID